MTAILLAAAILQAGPDDRVRTLEQRAADLARALPADAPTRAKVEALRRCWTEQARRLADSVRLAREAHAALDRDEYDGAVDRHRRSRALEREAAELDATAAGLLREAAEANVALLDRDEVEVRDAAARVLAALGAPAVPVLERALAGSKLEARLRIQDVLGGIRGDRGRPRVRLLKAAVSGERIPVEVEGLPGNHADWLTVVPAKTADANWAQYHYGNGQTGGTFEFAGLPPGDYEVRVYFDWPNGGYEVKARLAFKVTE